MKVTHCVKSFRIRSFSAPYSVRMREYTELEISEYGHFLRSVPLKNYFRFLSLTSHKMQDFRRLVGCVRGAVGYAWNIH